MAQIRVLLVDDHLMVRQGLKQFFEHHPRLHVVGEAGTLKEALHFNRQLCPQVVLMDYQLPDGDGIIGCINIKAASPDTKVILLTAYADEHILFAARQAKMDGYLLKDIDGDALAQKIVDICENAQVEEFEERIGSDQESGERMLREAGLSPKECLVLELLAAGRMNKEIAEEMGITHKTVRNYVTSIFRKLHVSNRTEAATLWIRQNTENR